MPIPEPATPALVVDLTVLTGNIRAMQSRVGAAGAALRPHVKTHKCLEIARLQRDAGARGITVATVAEAEIFVAGGFDDLFLAYPLWLDDARARRLAALTEQATVTLGCDSPDAARRLAAAFRRLGATPPRLLVEVDSGHHRSGVQPDEAGVLARTAVDLGLSVQGVFTFPGHSYSPTGRRAAAENEREALAVAAASLRSVGVEPVVVSGGSSPSVEFAAEGAATELRPGVYVTQDAQQWELGACGPEQIALTAHATVVSHGSGRAVLDAGSKILGADRPTWASGHGRLLDHPDARLVLLSEHHAVVELPGAPLPLGSRVRVVPNHACNAINLVDDLFIAQDGRLIDRWSVAARGANH